jgi:AICAR transformylase/IMP cyclohydrolase PurH
VRSDDEHVETLDEHAVEPIDLVCVNLYPFERVAARAASRTSEVIENIDIGGPTLIRAAAKNHAFSAVVVTPESYDAVLGELEESEGGCRADAPEPRAWRRSRTPRATTRRSRAGSRARGATSRRSTRARSRRCST